MSLVDIAGKGIRHVRWFSEFWGNDRRELYAQYLMGTQFCTFATMPRSGTWMCAMLFHAFNGYLNSYEIISDRIRLFNFYPDLKLNKFHNHLIFPGFRGASGKWDLRPMWDKLDFYVEGYDVGSPMLAGKPFFDPCQNPSARVIYVYRNPLDQCVSFYRHGKNHVNCRLTYAVRNGREQFISNANEFAEWVGLESYLKQFLTFHYMRNRCPNLLMVRYEDLVRTPREVFKGMLSFLGISTGEEEKAEALNRAVEYVNAENLKKLEQKLGRALGNDQRTNGESHMRGGLVGSWREHLSDETVQGAWRRFEEFGVDWRQEFVIE